MNILTGLITLCMMFFVSALFIWVFWNLCIPQLFQLPVITYWQAGFLYLLVRCFSMKLN